jgi:hypothetical protein
MGSLCPESKYMAYLRLPRKIITDPPPWPAQIPTMSYAQHWQQQVNIRWPPLTTTTTTTTTSTISPSSIGLSESKTDTSEKVDDKSSNPIGESWRSRAQRLIPLLLNQSQLTEPWTVTRLPDLLDERPSFESFGTKETLHDAIARHNIGVQLSHNNNSDIIDDSDTHDCKDHTHTSAASLSSSSSSTSSNGSVNKTTSDVNSNECTRCGLLNNDGPKAPPSYLTPIPSIWSGLPMSGTANALFQQSSLYPNEVSTSRSLLRDFAATPWQSLQPLPCLSYASLPQQRRHPDDARRLRHDDSKYNNVDISDNDADNYDDADRKRPLRDVRVIDDTKPMDDREDESKPLPSKLPTSPSSPSSPSSSSSSSLDRFMSNVLPPIWPLPPSLCQPLTRPITHGEPNRTDYSKHNSSDNITDNKAKQCSCEWYHFYDASTAGTFGHGCFHQPGDYRTDRLGGFIANTFDAAVSHPPHVP